MSNILNNRKLMKIFELLLFFNINIDNFFQIFNNNNKVIKIRNYQSLLLIINTNIKIRIIIINKFLVGSLSSLLIIF